MTLNGIGIQSRGAYAPAARRMSQGKLVIRGKTSGSADKHEPQSDSHRVVFNAPGNRLDIAA